MQLRVLYFAVARDRARGLSEEPLELPEGATVADLIAALGERHPELASLLPRIRFAVNEAFATPGTRLSAGDEVALIPPVAGG